MNNALSPSYPLLFTTYGSKFTLCSMLLCGHESRTRLRAEALQRAGTDTFLQE
jgi:hypothetical protein